MNPFKSLWIGLRSLFRRNQTESDLDEELRFHLEMEIQNNIAQGKSPAEAKRAALVSFGGLDQAKEASRDAWGLRFVKNVFRDLGFSVRMVWREKVFSIAVIATLALCIGANTTVFSVLHSLVLKAPPFADAQNVVEVSNYRDREAIEYPPIGWGQYRDFNENADLFEGFTLLNPVSKIVSTKPEMGLAITNDFFELFAVEPSLGRFFSADEEYPHHGNVVVLSHSSWEQDYAKDSNVVGREITFLNEAPRTIIGVAPKSLEFFDSRTRFYLPFRPFSEVVNDPQKRRNGGGNVWAKLKPGISRSAALTQLSSLEQRWYDEVADSRQRQVYETATRSIVFGQPNPFTTRLVFLQAGALFVLLVGAMNVINLQLARIVRRLRELAVRYSLGAGKLALARLLFCESLLLASLGALAGLGLAKGGLQIGAPFLAAFAPTAGAQLNGYSIMSAGIGAIGAAVAMGLIPFMILWRTNRIQSLDNSGRSASADAGTRAFSNGLVVSQIAITVTLMIGAGLMLRSFSNVRGVDPGFSASQVVMGSVDLSPLENASNFDPSAILNRPVNMGNFSSADAARNWIGIQIRERIIDVMREIPGVEIASYGAGQGKTVDQSPFTNQVAIKGTPYEGTAQDPQVVIQRVSGDFFATMGIPIVLGRSFFTGEGEDRYIIDATFAERYFKERNAIGAEMIDYQMDLSLRDSVDHWPRIVGIAARANFEGPEERDGRPVLYICNDQSAARRFDVLLRTDRSYAGVVSEMRTKLREIDPRLHLYNPTSLQSKLETLQLDRQGTTLLIGIFASLALLISAIGIYGVLAYDVQQRRREIGIRAAIGATPSAILTLIMRQGLRRTLIGLAIGLLGSFYLTRFLEARLFDVTAADPVTYLATIIFLLLVALLASFIPALRAVRINPVEALKTE